MQKLEAGRRGQCRSLADRAEQGALSGQQILQRGFAPAGKVRRHLHIPSICSTKGLLYHAGHQRCREHVRCCRA